MQRNAFFLFSLLLIAAHGRAQDSNEIPPPAIMEQPSNVDPLESADQSAPPPPAVETPASSGEPTTPEVVNTTPPAPAPSASELVQPVKKAKKKAKKTSKLSHQKKGFAAAVGDDPDLRKEEQFHQIYQKYNSQPTSEESWEKAVGDRKAETYKIQKGDTLWDVSQTFFGDANYWPKIWSLNVGEIGNPHEIDPNMAIQFYPGSMADAPTLGMIENEKVDGLKGLGTQVASTADTPLPARKKKMPVMRSLPPSIPLYRYGTVIIPPPSLELPTLKKSFPEQPEYLSYYVENESPATVGQVVETEMGMNTASEYQYVIVKIDKGSGQQLLAIKELGPVADLTSSSKAHLIEVQGAIEIVEKVNEGENLYRALVKKNLQPIAVGAKLMDGGIPTFDPSPTPVDSSRSALIVGGQYENERKLFGSRSIVFINAGSSQGLQAGQSLNVYSDIRNRNPKSRAQTNDRLVGTVKIVKVSGTFATAYVTQSTDDILVGDHVGAKTLVSTAPVVEELTEGSSGNEIIEDNAPLNSGESLDSEM